MYSESQFYPEVDIDWEQLTQLSEGNSEFELELLQMFVEDLPIYIGEMKKALVDSDLLTLKRVAHQIKGSSANLGAKKIEELATQLEKLCSANSLLSIEGKVTDLETNVVKIKELIAQRYGTV